MKLESDIHIKDDLGGPMSVKFKNNQLFNDYCSKHIENFNPDRFEVLAVRFYYGKEISITVFAIDKERQEGTNFQKEKMPVKKFKLGFSFVQNLLPLIEECNFTLTTGNYPLADMEVINK